MAATTKFSQHANLITKYFATQWATVRPTVPVAYSDKPPPAINTSDVPWARMTIIFGPSILAGLGTPRTVRDTGIVEGQIFTPIAQGDGLTTEIADDFASLFDVLTVTDGVLPGRVRFKVPYLTRIGEDEKSACYQVNVTAPWYADRSAALIT